LRIIFFTLPRGQGATWRRTPGTSEEEGSAMEPLRVLIFEDSEDDTALLISELRRQG
jgi:hypothetical protein